MQGPELGRPKAGLDTLPEGWEMQIIEMYLEGASDVEVKAEIYKWRGSFSNNLWERWMEEEPFGKVIEQGRLIRGNKLKKPTNPRHLEILKRRRQNRKYEYIGENKLIVSLKSLMSFHVKNRKSKFKKTTFELLGYDKDEYIKNIISKLKPGMNIENYGQWHIDHIRPCSSFNLNDTEEIKKCWSLENLDPKWAIDNIRKGNKY